MQLQYSTDELVHMITTNNLAGVFTRLVTERRVDAAIPPNVDAISYAIQEQSGRLSPEAFLKWLEDLMDVPIDQSRVFASELTAVQQFTGKSPAQLLADQIRSNMPQQAPIAFPNLGRQPQWLAWIVISLTVIGLLSVLRYLGRILEKAAA